MDFRKFITNSACRRRPSMIRKWVHRIYVCEADVYLSSQTGITLANGMPNAETFPFKEISITLKDGTERKLLGKELQTSLQYGPSKGFPPLVKKFREFQEMIHKPKMKDWDVSFTCGSQDGCSKIFEILVNPGEPVMMQTPLYTGVIGAIMPLAPEFIEIKQDADGIIPEEIEKICSERRKHKQSMPKLLYVNPIGSNPTGTILPLSRRIQIHRLSQEYDFIIVEDDPYYFVQFTGEDLPSFLSMDTEGRVVRLDSFSKVVSAGLRLGTVTAHKSLIDCLILHTESSIMHASSLSQMVLYKVFDSWGPEKLRQHFLNIQQFYRERRDIMLAALEKHLTGLAEWTVPNAGMFFWIEVTCMKDVMELSTTKCFRENLFVLPGHAFHYNNNIVDNHLRLSFSYATPQDIDKALEILAKLIHEESTK